MLTDRERLQLERLVSLAMDARELQQRGLIDADTADHAVESCSAAVQTMMRRI